jgi:hypothetical protein
MKRTKNPDPNQLLTDLNKAHESVTNTTVEYVDALATKKAADERFELAKKAKLESTAAYRSAFAALSKDPAHSSTMERHRNNMRETINSEVGRLSYVTKKERSDIYWMIYDQLFLDTGFDVRDYGKVPSYIEAVDQHNMLDFMRNAMKKVKAMLLQPCPI